MRKGGPSDIREAKFKASAKGKEKEDLIESGYISEEEYEINFVKKLQWGSIRLRGKLPFKCFAFAQLADHTNGSKMLCSYYRVSIQIKKTSRSSQELVDQSCDPAKRSSWMETSLYYTKGLCPDKNPRCLRITFPIQGYYITENMSYSKW